jgi:hypothetical protein
LLAALLFSLGLHVATSALIASAFVAAALPQPHAAHSQFSQVQNSPVQSGHLQPTQAHDLAVAAVFLAAQHECEAGVAPSDCSAEAPLQLQPLHVHTVQVQNSPLQSGQAHSMQPQLLDIAEFCDTAVKAQATPLVIEIAATMIDRSFMNKSFCG